MGALATADFGGGAAGALLQTLLALVAVSSLAVVILRLLKRRAPPASRALRVLARLPLEPGRSLVIVEAAGKFLLVGVGDGPMNLIAELDGAQLTPAALAAHADPRSPSLASSPEPSPPLSGALRDALRKVLASRLP